MDPLSACATIAGLAVAIEQIVAAIYQYGKGVKDSKKEISRLCSELFALKGALEHVRTNLQDAGASSMSAPASLFSPITTTKEFINMLDTTKSALADLFQRLEKPHGRITTALNRLMWPLKKDDVRNETQRLERLKSYFILAATTDNVCVVSRPCLQPTKICFPGKYQSKHILRSALLLKSLTINKHSMIRLLRVLSSGVSFIYCRKMLTSGLKRIFASP